MHALAIGWDLIRATRAPSIRHRIARTQLLGAGTAERCPACSITRPHHEPYDP